MTDQKPEIFIRASSLTQYPDCAGRVAGQVFRPQIEAAGYTLRERQNGIGAAVGTAVHAGAAASMKHKAEHGNIGPDDAATDCAVQMLRETVAQGVIYDQATPALNTGEKQTVKMLRSFRNRVAPAMTPVLVEERLEAEVAPGLVLTGHADLIAQENDGTVDDIKTGVRERAHAPQLGAYALLGRSNRYKVNRLSSTYIPRVGVDKSQPDPIRRAYPVAGAENAALNIIRAMYSDLHTFQHGNRALGLLPGDSWAFMKNPQSNLCSARYCPCFDTDFCREGIKGEIE